MAYKTKLCYNCGKEFIPNGSRQKYCVECRQKTCEYCGKIFHVKKGQYKQRFCSLSCKSSTPDNIENLKKHKGNRKRKRCFSNCFVCGNKFEHGIWRNSKYCSRECWEKRNPQIEIKCLFCGKIFLDYESCDRKYCSKKCYNSHRKILYVGENHPNWQGGITQLQLQIRHSNKYNMWRKEIFEINGFKCQNSECKSYKGCYLEAHHIKEFAIIMKENNITTLDGALNCDELWDINNGITYCDPCHMKLHGLNKKEIDNLAQKGLSDFE